MVDGRSCKYTLYSEGSPEIKVNNAYNNNNCKKKKNKGIGNPLGKQSSAILGFKIRKLIGLFEQGWQNNLLPL